MVTTPTGRQFAFPDAKRRGNGGITYFTSIKNYPVQSVATDIVQFTLLLVEKRIQKKQLRSMIVNSIMVKFKLMKGLINGQTVGYNQHR